MSIKQSFEYHVENIVIPYKTLTKGVAMFKHKEDTLEPDDHPCSTLCAGPRSCVWARKAGSW